MKQKGNLCIKSGDNLVSKHTQILFKSTFVSHRESAASADDPPDLSERGERVPEARGGGLSAGRQEDGEQQRKHAQQQRLAPTQQEVRMRSFTGSYVEFVDAAAGQT